VIGWREWVKLSDLGVSRIKVKVDTGARSSALHAYDVKEFTKDGEAWVRFKIHPDQRSSKKIVRAEAKILDYRMVKNTGGKATKRPVILTHVTLLDMTWSVELTLANRDEMGFRMLLGREAIRRRLLVDPGGSYYGGKPKRKKKPKQSLVFEETNKTMKLGILSCSTKCYSTRRLVEAAKQRGHDVDVLNTTKLSIDLREREPGLYYDQKQIFDYDAVIPRIGTSITYFGTAVVRQFEQMDIYSVNSSAGITNSRDKLRSLQIFSRHNIGIPPTTYVKNKKDVLPAIERVGGAPVVIKLIEGTQGIGVLLADTIKSAEGIIELLQSQKQNVLIQKFVAESKGKDIRAF
ncbi:UNVERIFIED_CONTAM: hypothetical protein GTU68_019938, partial [Idotea baltica]|nr:hypothetical protein [Idotea baltica]